MSRPVALILAGFLSVVTASIAAPSDPQALVQETSQRMIDAVRAERVAIERNPARLIELAEDIVVPYFDFERISRWVLGKYWRRASPDQRERFTREFTTLLVRTYATALSQYNDEKIKYLPLRMRQGEEEVRVRTEVHQPGAFPIPIDYVLYNKDGQWKVFDVVIDDISLVANYRTTFGNEVQSKGIEHLITTLAERNRQQRR